MPVFKRLEVVEVMKTFITQQMGGSEELRSKLVQTEGDFAVAYKAIADGAEALRKTGE